MEGYWSLKFREELFLYVNELFINIVLKVIKFKINYKLDLNRVLVWVVFKISVWGWSVFWG